MPSPGATQAVQRPDIRGAVVEVWDLNQEEQNFIANDVAKRIDVDFASSTVRRIPREAFTDDPLTVDRGPDGSYGRSDWGDQALVVTTKEQGQEMPVDENMAQQTKMYYDAEVVAGRIAFSKVKRAHEILVANTCMNTATWTGATLTAAAAANWKSAQASAVPIADIRNARQNVRNNCGRDANTVIMDWTVWENLRETSQIVGRFSGGARTDMPASATLAAVADIIEVPNIVIARGIKKATNQGQLFTGAGIWSTSMCMVAYINPGASLWDINLINCYNWEGDGGSFDWTVESYYDLPRRRDIVRVRRQVGVKAEYPECGFLLTNCG